MNTTLLLMAEHERAILPAETVCERYFAPMSFPVFLRKISEGEIDLKIVRMGQTQKAPRMVHLSDLADYIDRQRKAAKVESMKPKLAGGYLK